MTYKEQLTSSMDMLAEDPQTLFIGYGLRTGRAMGTLANVPEDRLIEFPVAEGLMTSAAIGMALMGYKPVVYFERMDFMMNAMDAIVNHLNAVKKLSRGEFAPALIIRATVGNSQKPNFTGPVHTQDFTEVFDSLGMIVWPLKTVLALKGGYEAAIKIRNDGDSVILVEYKDLL